MLLCKVTNMEWNDWDVYVSFNQAVTTVAFLASSTNLGLSLRSLVNQFLIAIVVMPRFLAIISFSMPVIYGSLLNLLFKSDNWCLVNRDWIVLLPRTHLCSVSNTWLKHVVGPSEYLSRKILLMYCTTSFNYCTEHWHLIFGIDMYICMCINTSKNHVKNAWKAY